MKKETMKTVEALVRAGIADPAECAAVLARLAGQSPARRDKLLTAKQAAEIAGVHKRTVQAWGHKGFLHPKKITSRRVRFSRAELEDFLCETAEG